MRVCAANRVFSAHGLGLAGYRIKSGMTETMVCKTKQQRSLPLLCFSRYAKAKPSKPPSAHHKPSVPP
ncbi:MAG TPA: hypothetical protein DCW88_10655 [Agrobacterium sp.]|nr:hypothetical protein EGT36_11365 [Agrobacterium sp. FDAARGOS_525]HAU75962.1 hypothetical protein [Agrobacterium sp.]